MNINISYNIDEADSCSIEIVKNNQIIDSVIMYRFDYSSALEYKKTIKKYISTWI